MLLIFAEYSLVMSYKSHGSADFDLVLHRKRPNPKFFQNTKNKIELKTNFTFNDLHFKLLLESTFTQLCR